MAEKRMFSHQIIDSDAFLDMPLSAQALYFHLSMRADDDGFLNNHARIMRTINASKDDFKILIAKNFILEFETGVIVIKHWRINNYLRNDRHKDTVYVEELSKLQIKPNGAYSLGIPNDNQVVDSRYTQNRIEENRIDKSRIEEISNVKKSPRKRVPPTAFIPPTLEEIVAYVQERKSTVDAKRFYDYFNAGNWKDAKGNQVKNWKQKLITWETHNNGNNGNKAESKPLDTANDGFTYI
jgi:hypothetical protein